MKYCSKCGSKLEDNVTKCPKCGYPSKKIKLPKTKITINGKTISLIVACIVAVIGLHNLLYGIINLARTNYYYTDEKIISVFNCIFSGISAGAICFGCLHSWKNKYLRITMLCLVVATLLNVTINLANILVMEAKPYVTVVNFTYLVVADSITICAYIVAIILQVIQIKKLKTQDK